MANVTYENRYLGKPYGHGGLIQTMVCTGIGFSVDPDREYIILSIRKISHLTSLVLREPTVQITPSCEEIIFCCMRVTYEAFKELIRLIDKDDIYDIDWEATVRPDGWKTNHAKTIKITLTPGGRKKLTDAGAKIRNGKLYINKQED